MKRYIQPVSLLTEFHAGGTLLNASMEFGSDLIDISGQESRRRNWYTNTWIDYDDEEEDEF